MNALLVSCKICEKRFEPPHFNSKCCSDECRVLARKIVRKKYKKSDKGMESEKRYMAGEAYKEKENRYRSKPKSKALAYKRSKRCLENNKHLQESKRIRDIEYGRSERGREVNLRAAAKYRKTEKGVESRKNSKARRRTLKKEGNVSLSKWKSVLKIYKYKCAGCGVKGDLEMDHIYPLSKGGAHCVTNIQPLCRSCNASKGAKIYGW